MLTLSRPGLGNRPLADLASDRGNVPRKEG
jgi:hypothetical protein